MGINLAWDNESRTVLRIDFEGLWDWTAYNAAMDEAYTMIRTSNRIINVISNMPSNMALPPGLPLRHFQRAQQMMPDNLGVLMVVGGNWAARAMELVFRHYRDEKVVTADSLEEARKKLDGQSPLGGHYAKTDHILL